MESSLLDGANLDSLEYIVYRLGRHGGPVFSKVERRGARAARRRLIVRDALRVMGDVAYDAILK